MSTANVEIVQSICAPWGRGDFSSAEWAHPEIEYVQAGKGPEVGVWTGVAAMAEAFRNWLSGWEDLRIEVDEYRELDDQRALALTQFIGRGKASGLEVGYMRSEGAALFHLHRGRVTRLVVYMDRESAPAVLGLGSEAGSSEA